jgi:hypothetical protein
MDADLAKQEGGLFAHAFDVADVSGVGHENFTINICVKLASYARSLNLRSAAS